MLKLPISKKSFGLVELIVALAIVVVILTLSTVGINSLRESFQLNSGTQELFNAISLARVYAENNVTFKNPDLGNQIQVPDGYMVEIGDSDGEILLGGGAIQNVKIKACVLLNNEKSFNAQSIGSNVKCYEYLNKAIDVDLAGVEILKDRVSNIEGCARILFSVQENEIFVIVQGSGGGKNGGPTQFNSTTTCGVSVKGINSGVGTRIVVNPVNRTIKKI